MHPDIPAQGQAVALVVLPGDHPDLAVVKGVEQLLAQGLGGRRPWFARP